MAPTTRVNTATLIRGEVYTLRHPDNTAKNPVESLRFTYDVPVVIAEKKILELLEDIYDETEDGDGELYEKPTFRIDRGVQPPDDGKRKAKRLDASRSVKTSKRRIKR